MLNGICFTTAAKQLGTFGVKDRLMFECDELIYVQLQKTACTHIAMLLGKIFQGKQIGKHNVVYPKKLQSSKYIISSIRNPWDWYLSLWTFGFTNIGIKNKLTNRKLKPKIRKLLQNPANARNNVTDIYFELIKDVTKWRKFYDRNDNVISFRKWLKMINDKRGCRHIGKKYYLSGTHKHCGLMTFRYLRLCCQNFRSLNQPDYINSYDSIWEHDRDNCFIDYFIRQENLEDTLCEAIEQVRPLTPEEKHLIYSAGKTNSSQRVLSLSEFYDEESIQLVAERDRLIVDKFAYSPPDLSGPV